MDEYGWVMSAELIRRLRGQEQYDGAEPLRAQIERDCIRTRLLVDRAYPEVMEDSR